MALQNAALEQHRVVTGFEGAQAFVDDRMSQHRGRGRAVAGDVVGLGRSFLEQLGAHVLERILELDFLGDGNAVVGDGGGAKFAVHSHIAALGAEGCAHRIGDHIHAVLKVCGGHLLKIQVVLQPFLHSSGISLQRRPKYHFHAG